MKIKALRLAEVGQFSMPVAVEGFSGALDVLTGPNEIGKSTLFNALSTLLTEKHTSTSKALAPLRADSGGAPLIEADLEINGHTYRLRKRFLAQKSAELIDLDSAVSLRGNDAENEIERLLGGDKMRALRGLVWVRQGESFDLPAARPDLLAGLAELIEQEAADTAGAGDVRRLAANIRQRLGELVTAANSKPKAGTAYYLAVHYRNDLRVTLGAMQDRFSAAASRRTRREELQREEHASASPAHAENLAAQARQALKAVADADRARERLRAADERVRARQLAHDGAQNALTREQQRLLEVERLTTAISTAVAAIQDSAVVRADLERQHAVHVTNRDALAAEVEAARQHIASAQASAVRHAARRALTDLDRRIEQASDSHRRITAATEQLAANSATEAAVEHLSDLAIRLSNLDSRISSQSPRAAIAYLPGITQRIRIAGREIPDGEPIKIEGRTQIAIDGIGTLTIEPGDGDGRAVIEQRDACRIELNAGFAALGVIDLERAKLARAERREVEAAIAAHRSRLSNMASDGLAPLEASRTHLLATHPGLAQGETETSPLSPADFASLETSISDRLVALQDLSHRCAAAARTLHEADATAAIAQERLAADRRRLCEVETAQPFAPAHDALLAKLDADHVAAATDLAEAIRDRAAWADAVPELTAYDALVAEAARTSAALATFNQRRQALERETAELDGAMQRDGEEGIGAEIARLEEELVEAETRVADFELDVNALQMLLDRIERISLEHRSTVLRPLLARLEPLLADLFPGARIALDGPLLVARLERNTRADSMIRLSGGTREQVATLVRIAHAGLLAAQGMPLPLVLDDALVYSDDTRLEQMIGALATASLRHQVILLSCHQRALEPLIAAHGACRLTVAPWRDANTFAIERQRRPQSLKDEKRPD